LSCSSIVKKKNDEECAFFFDEAYINGGERGIRTPEPCHRLTDLQSDPFNHSGISPLYFGPAVQVYAFGLLAFFFLISTVIYIKNDILWSRKLTLKYIKNDVR
jgi:hypothetical protein